MSFVSDAFAVKKKKLPKCSMWSVSLKASLLDMILLYKIKKKLNVTKVSTLHIKKIFKSSNATKVSPLHMIFLFKIKK